MNKKIQKHVQVQLKEIIKISNVMNSGLSDRLQIKMKLNCIKRGREILKTLEKNDLSSAWLEEIFGISIDDMNDMIKEL